MLAAISNSFRSLTSSNKVSSAEEGANPEPETGRDEEPSAPRREVAITVDKHEDRDARDASVDSALTEFSDRGVGLERNDKREVPVRTQLPTPSPSSASFSSAKPPTRKSTKPSRLSLSAFKSSRSSRRTSRGGGGSNGNEEDESVGKDGKEYLVAGLYYSPGITPHVLASRGSSSSSSSSASTTKQDRRKSTATTTSPASLSWRTITPSRTTLFPPPIHHGLTLIEDDEEPFELPYDILRDFYYAEDAQVNGKGAAGMDGDEDMAEHEGTKGARKPPPYRHLSKNCYVDRKPDKAPIAAVCMCAPPKHKSASGCLDGCINRMMQYCCDPKLCPCGEQCSNLPLNKREGIPEGKDGLRVVWTGDRGFGLKTTVPIRRGDFVIEYRGEIITRDESYRRVLTDYKDRSDYYFLEYDTFEVIDAGQRGNSARFINHSCGPNCEVVRWRLAGLEEYQVGIFARRDIRPGEELTYNYGWCNFADLAKPNPASSDKSGPPPLSSTSTSSSLSSLSSASSVEDDAPIESAEVVDDIARQRCFCGSVACSGYLGGKPKTVAAGRGEAPSSSSTSISSSSRPKVKPALSAAATKGKGKAREPPIEWVQAKVVLSETKVVSMIDASDRRAAKRLKETRDVPSLGRGSSLRRAAHLAKDRLSGQR
ncbi:hypothetical protein JCM10212_002635 [Sporobolomyces blumeae]